MNVVEKLTTKMVRKMWITGTIKALITGSVNHLRCSVHRKISMRAIFYLPLTSTCSSYGTLEIHVDQIVLLLACASGVP